MRFITLFLLLTLTLPVTLAHFAPTADEQAIMNQVSAPNTATLCGGNSTPFVQIGVTYTHLVFLGASDTSDSDPPGIVAGAPSSGAASSELFRVTKMGVLSNIGSGVTAHLLFHQNLTIAGTSNAWWAVVELIVPNVERSWLTYTNGGNRHLSNYALSGLNNIVGNFTGHTQPGCEALITGRVFNATFPPPSPRNPPLFGDDGALVGGDVSNLAEAIFGRSGDDAETATYFFVGLLLVVGIGAGVGGVTNAIGGGIAALMTMIFLSFTGWWPTWIVVFACVVTAGIALLFTRRGGV